MKSRQNWDQSSKQNNMKANRRLRYSSAGNTETDLNNKIAELGGFKFIRHIPSGFINKEKLENFILSLEEETRLAVKLASLPYHIVIEPTNICNLRCPLCSTGSGSINRAKGIMKLDEFKKAIDKVKGFAIELYLQNWGEPTLVPHLPEMIKYASANGIWTNLSSNFSINYPEGYLYRLVTSGLVSLRVDIDGATQDIYSHYRRGGDLGLVLQNLKTAISLKKKKGSAYPVIEAVMLVMRHNEHQIDDFSGLCRQIGLKKYSFGKIQLNPNTALEWLPRNRRYKYETYQLPAKPRKCHWPWSGIVINWDGGISPCCIVDDIKADFGNIFSDNLKNIWNNRSYISARMEFSKVKKINKRTICNICRNNTHSKKLKRVKDSFSLML